MRFGVSRAEMKLAVVQRRKRRLKAGQKARKRQRFQNKRKPTGKRQPRRKNIKRGRGLAWRKV